MKKQVSCVLRVKNRTLAAGTPRCENQAVGHQVVVLDDLPLLIAAVFSDDPFAAKENPLQDFRNWFGSAAPSVGKRGMQNAF